VAKPYKNRWIPARALEALAGESGPILDVGGGAAPYGRASHILDIMPFDASRLEQNAWGADPSGWQRAHYTEFDLCANQKWPFEDGTFALGLCSHSLEDLRDPLPILQEMGRVCKRILVITPSRLLEQMRGADHPRYCGFFHHPWIVYQDGRELVFRRKTMLLNLPGAHLVCPFGRTLSVEDGAFMYLGEAIPGRELVFWSEEDDLAEYRQFVASVLADSPPRFVPNGRSMLSRRFIFYLRQKLFGAV